MTSLAEQLNRLKAPQTSIYLQDKKKASLLFDPKEAASADKKTFFKLGNDGLQELIELNKRFQKFEDSLFSETSIDLVRSMKNAEANKKLNILISEFLVLATPYFLLPSTHKALEWLIHRFQIHDYNKDSFLMFILPYHESRMFVRALQLTDISNPGDKWHWLSVLQEKGQPLGIFVLLKHLNTDKGLLKLIAEHVLFATKTYSHEANTLSTLYSFYTKTIVGWLSKAPEITETQINHILPAIVAGLSSNIANFSAGTYMILAQLIKRVKLIESDANVLLLKIAKQDVLKTEALLMITIMFSNPFNRVEVMSEKLMIRLIKTSWLIETLAKLKQIGTKTEPFVSSLFKTSLQYLIKEEETNNKSLTINSDMIKDIINKIVDDVSLEPEEINTILSIALENDISVVKEHNEFFVNLFTVLERRYPDTFDAFLKKIMDVNYTDGLTINVRRALKFLTTWHAGSLNMDNSLDVINKLNHASPMQRIAGLQLLADSEFKINDNIKPSLIDALLARFDDNEPEVIEALLSIPVNKLKRLTCTELVDKLLILLNTCHTKQRKFLAGPALNILLNVYRDEDDLTLFLSTLPFLFPCNEEDVPTTMQILRSNYASRNRYMIEINKDIDNQRSAKEIRSVAFHHLLNRSLLPETDAILNSIEEFTNGDAASNFFNMMVLGTICRVQVGRLSTEEARKTVELIAKMMTFPRIQCLTDITQMNSENLLDALLLTERDIVPLQAATYVLEMIHRRVDISTDSRIDFEKYPERSQLILSLLEFYFEGISRVNRRHHYQWCLKIFFQRHFTSGKNMLIFLSRFFVKPVKVSTTLNCLCISLSLLEKCNSIQWIFEDNIFIPHLLLAMSSEETKCRHVATKILQSLIRTFNLNNEGFYPFLQELQKRQVEIAIDSDQLALALYMLLSPDPDVNHQYKPKLRKQLKYSRDKLFEIMHDEDTPINVVAQLLQLLVHVNSIDIFRSLTPLGQKLLNQKSNGNDFTRNTLKHILLRFNNDTAEALQYEEVWNFFENSISRHDAIVTDDSEQTLITPSTLVMKQITEVFFTRLNKASPETSNKVLGMLVNIVTYCNVSNVVIAASRVVRRIRIDAKIIVDELKKMIDVKSQMQNKFVPPGKKRKSVYMPSSPEVINTNEWKRGQTILEFVQDAYNVDNDHMLVPILLDLLKLCLSFEEQNPLEYTNQLILSTLLHLVKKEKKNLMKDAHLHIGLIAQCIRISHNPQTHHHALLLLVELFKLADIQIAMHQVMQIFTFMGNSVLRQDDAYSIQIISKTIETIVPTINAANNENHACELFRIFVTSFPDIPEHRRKPIFSKLLQLLNNYLYLYYMLSLERHVKSQTDKDDQVDKTHLRIPSKKLHFSLHMSEEFEAKQIVEVCVEIGKFLLELPINLEDIDDAQKKKFHYNHVFDLQTCTSRELRHMKYVTIQFLTAMLSVPHFINKIAQLPPEESQEINEDFNKLIVILVQLIGTASKLSHSMKYWRVMLFHTYEALDCVNNLLPNTMFLDTVKRLIKHKIPVVRRKALELLNARLQQKVFSEDEYNELLALINLLMEIIEQPIESANQDLEVIQQTALVSVKFLAKIMASHQRDVFIPVLDVATKLLMSREGPILASAALCIAELCSSIGPYAVKSLNKFFPEILRLLDSHCCQETPDITALSIVSTLQKVIESVGNFISRDHTDQLLIKLCKLSTFYADSQQPKVETLMTRVKATIQKLASNTPLRILLPAINRTYDTLIKNKLVNYIVPLMGILSESFHTIQAHDLNNLVFNSKEQDLTTFFLKVFEFREQVTKEHMDISFKDIIAVEESSSKALVALVLKLSETTFRPLYYKFYDWAARNPSKKNRNITFYRLSANIAECLKSLFVLFAGHFVKHAADLLEENHISKKESMVKDDEPEQLDDTYRIELTEAILLTLMRTFEHDAHDFVNEERFVALMKQLVDQLENTLGSVEEYEKRSRELIVPCIGAFASAIVDDSLHHQLIYNIILKSNNEKLHVRVSVLNTLVEIVIKLGKDFMPLLSEIIPTLSEMQEDEEMQKDIQNAIWTLEDILEQPLNKYL